MNPISLWFNNRVLFRKVKESLDLIDNTIVFDINEIIELLNRLGANDLTLFNRRIHNYPMRANFRNYQELINYLNTLLEIISNKQYKDSRLKYTGSYKYSIDDFFTDNEDNLISVTEGMEEIRVLLKDISILFNDMSKTRLDYYNRSLYPVAYTTLHAISSITGFIYEK